MYIVRLSSFLPFNSVVKAVQFKKKLNVQILYNNYSLIIEILTQLTVSVVVIALFFNECLT